MENRITAKKETIDMRDVKGQEHVKRALEVACTGGHSVLLVGPSGCGKTMLAHRASTITDKTILILDNIVERSTVSLRKQLDKLEYVEKIIIGVMLPCPCGNFTSPKRECCCTPKQIQKYVAKLPNFIRDRIDIHVDVPELNYSQLSDRRTGESSADIKKRISAVRLQKMEMDKVDKEAQELLKMAIVELGLSARAYSKIITIAGTIACMDKKEKIEACHLSEAISYGCMDRNI